MSKKRTVWVLDTETKGTGAEMVPLERLEERKRLMGGRERLRVLLDHEPKGSEEAAEAATPRVPRRFRVVDVRSRQMLADDVGVSEAIHALRDVGSVVDVNVYVWEPDREDWRPLSLSERKALWGFRQTD
jgi:hypothetical protein